MGIGRRNAIAAEPKDPAETYTFFGAGTPAAEPKNDPPAPAKKSKKPAKEAPQQPAGTFFANRYTDPLTELSTHRKPGWTAMSEQERAARKEAEETRARTGLERLMQAMNRTRLI